MNYKVGGGVKLANEIVKLTCKSKWSELHLVQKWGQILIWPHFENAIWRNIGTG